MEDAKKVEHKVKELNALHKTDKWDSVDGFHSMPTVLIAPDLSQSVDPEHGVTLKLFVNIETKEIKVFHFKGFTK